MKTLSVLQAGLLVVLAGFSRARAQEPARLTGEIKPVAYVTDVERSARFWTEVLGFELLGYSELDGETYYAELAAGETKLGLHEPLSEADEELVGRIKLYFRVEELESHRAFVSDGGGEPSEIRETSYMDFFVVQDPDGNQVRFGATDPERHLTDPWRKNDGQADPQMEGRGSVGGGSVPPLHPAAGYGTHSVPPRFL